MVVGKDNAFMIVIIGSGFASGSNHLLIDYFLIIANPVAFYFLCIVVHRRINPY